MIQHSGNLLAMMRLSGKALSVLKSLFNACSACFFLMMPSHACQQVCWPAQHIVQIGLLYLMSNHASDHHQFSLHCWSCVWKTDTKMHLPPSSMTQHHHSLPHARHKAIVDKCIERMLPDCRTLWPGHAYVHICIGTFTFLQYMYFCCVLSMLFLVVISLLYMAYRDSCRHNLIFLLRLKPYPMRWHRVLC